MTIFNELNPPELQTAQAVLGQLQRLPYSGSERVPFKFSSTLRDIAYQQQAGLSTLTIDGGQNISVTNALVTGISRALVPGSRASVETLINPRSVSFIQGKRIQRRDVRDGSVFFHFTDKDGRDNDILELELSGTTGNVDLRGDAFPLPATDSIEARRKLDVFYQLWTLTREPRIIAPNLVNRMSINMRTTLFPGLSGISFFGFFSEVLRFEQSADKPHSVDWSMRFTVQFTSPSIDDIQNLLVEDAQETELTNDASVAGT